MPNIRKFEGGCKISFHRVGTQLPREVRFALDRRAGRTALRFPRLHAVRFGGSALPESVETHRIEGGASNWLTYICIV